MISRLAIELAESITSHWSELSTMSAHDRKQRVSELCQQLLDSSGAMGPFVKEFGTLDTSQVFVQPPEMPEPRRIDDPPTLPNREIL